MKRSVWGSRLSLLVGTALAGVAVVHMTRSSAAEKAAPKGPAFPGMAVRPFDRPKNVIEGPAKRLLAQRTAVETFRAAQQYFANPKVEAGKVRWHRTFADACAAARQSGKPVLLFQMMGQLDQRFC